MPTFSNHKHYIDTIFRLVMLISTIICMVLIILTLAMFALSHLEGARPSWMILLLCVPFVVLTFILIRSRKELLGVGPQRRTYVLLFAASAIAMLFAFPWFNDPMHDIALLFFDSHGRWGCRDIGVSYFFCDTTMPFILFMPIIFSTIIHWRYCVNNEKDRNRASP